MILTSFREKTLRTNIGGVLQAPMLQPEVMTGMNLEEGRSRHF